MAKFVPSDLFTFFGFCGRADQRLKIIQKGHRFLPLFVGDRTIEDCEPELFETNLGIDLLLEQSIDQCFGPCAEHRIVEQEKGLGGSNGLVSLPSDLSRIDEVKEAAKFIRACITISHHRQINRTFELLGRPWLGMSVIGRIDACLYESACVFDDIQSQRRTSSTGSQFA